MKFGNSLTLVALTASLFYTSTEAVVSAGCSTYLDTLAQPTNPLAKCRTYTALGFPGITHANDHDTVKLQTALTAFCATPACTQEQYAGVYKDIQTNCGADMVAENEATLGATLYMWYLSPPQREAICLQNPTTNTTCVIDSVNEMIARNQLPHDNKNEDDLYGYLQFVTPALAAVGGNTTAFCTECNQEVANIFSNYYKKNPSTFPLNFNQKLSSTTLNNDLEYQYKSSCKADIGTDKSAFKPTTPKDNKGSDNTDSSAGSLTISFGTFVGAALIAMVML
ncbi:hypothetical protein BGZ76_000699 [Entomortierella beljakovae]|nr:hypothetical protein BGZ76_000699 [Entomortierella beljakovae]